MSVHIRAAYRARGAYWRFVFFAGEHSERGQVEPKRAPDKPLGIPRPARVSLTRDRSFATARYDCQLEPEPDTPGSAMSPGRKRMLSYKDWEDDSADDLSSVPERSEYELDTPMSVRTRHTACTSTMWARGKSGQSVGAVWGGVRLEN